MSHVSTQHELAPDTQGATVHDLDEARRRHTPTTLAPIGKPQPTAQPERAKQLAVFTARVRTVATHRLTRAAAHPPLCLPRGGKTVMVRAWESRSTARHERMLRAAIAAGDHATALEWEARTAAFRRERHERRMAILAVPWHAAKATVTIAGLTLGGLLALGIVLAIANSNVRDVIGPITALIETVRWCVSVFDVLWRPVLLALPVAALFALWQTGRRTGEAPAWLRPAGQSDSTGAPITPSIVVVALRDLGIAALRTAIREMGDAGAAMLGPIRIAGCGVEVDVTLPSGVSTAEVQKQRRRLAENLGRHEHELFITIPQAARTVRLWIADSGALDEPIGPSPLVIDATSTADLYAGRAPWGVDLRGDAALISLHQRMLLITGLSNQGKTAALRALALWAALDASVEFRIGDLKGVGDWRMFDGLAAVLIQGPTDEHVIAVVEMIEAVVAEMERRLVALEQSGATDGVTREMAGPGCVFHPLIAIVDEAQVAFMCPAIGEDKRPYGGSKATSRYFMACRKIHNQGRAVNVTLWQGTQDPTDQNLPKLVREGAHIRAGLVLGTEAQARMALGDKAVNGGAAPHKLRVGLDKGTVVVAGDGVKLDPNQSAITIRTHYIDGEHSAQIAERAKARRKPIATRTALTDDEPETPRDLLDDLAAVLGDSPVPTADVPGLLRTLAPTWAPYRALSGKDLRARLAEFGVKVPSTGNRFPLDPAAIRRALARRGSVGGASRAE
jgi:DNA segregation ATPase FtsK/SpoIIIE, S-DNA-T family